MSVEHRENPCRAVECIPRVRLGVFPEARGLMSEDAVVVPRVLAEWRRRWIRSSVAGVLARVPTPVAVDDVQSVLRSVLHDPTASVVFRSTDGSGAVASDGVPAPESLTEPGRRRIPLTGSAGETFAVLSVQDRPDLDEERLEAVVTVCTPALENTRLQSVLRARLLDLQESRARIVQSALAERRRLARDLHDGAQQHLVVLATRLGLASQMTEDPRAAGALDAAQGDLRQALAGLRSLVRSIYPSALDSEGLMPVLENFADEAPLELDLHGDVGRLPHEVEIVTYLSIRELVDGLSQTAASQEARVTVETTTSGVLVTIVADGLLDPSATPAWLSIVTDRVRALGGDLALRSAAPQPTDGEALWLQIRIPSESSSSTIPPSSGTA